MKDFLSNKDSSDEFKGQSLVGEIVNFTIKTYRHRLYTGYKGQELLACPKFVTNSEYARSPFMEKIPNWWKPINERLLVYAPTEDADEEDKDMFYSAPQGLLEGIPRHDVLLLLGNFNGRVGNDNTNREIIMGKQGLGDMKKKNNGERLTNICEENYLVIGGTEIDHIMINRKWRKTLLDVRVMRNANVGSDHNHLEAKLTLNLRKTKVGESKNKQFDAIRLQDQAVRRYFSIALRNRFDILQDKALMTIEDFNEAITQTAEETIGYKTKVKSEWISPETWTIIENRKLTKKKKHWMLSHHDSKKDIKPSTRTLTNRLRSQPGGTKGGMQSN